MHRTAIKRSGPSRPLRYGLGVIVYDVLSCRKAARALDYGCGRGADVQYLLDMGFVAEGYDPNNSEFDTLPSGRFDIIFCTYVLNTIEDDAQIDLALDTMIGLLKPRSWLLVAARDVWDIGRSRNPRWTPCGDGWITGNGTFQRGFIDESLAALTRDACQRMGRKMTYLDSKKIKRGWAQMTAFIE